jgi:hypothetical protein
LIASAVLEAVPGKPDRADAAAGIARERGIQRGL